MRIAALLLALLLPLAAPAADLYTQPATPEQLAKQLTGRLKELRSAQVLRGGFVQKKHLAGIPHPLKSTGTFLFVRERGIQWHTTSPFDSDFTLTAKEMVVTDSGSVAMRMQTAQQPGLKLVSDIFLAMFALDFTSLATHFDLFESGTASWEVGLKPRDAALAAVATRIRLAGRDTVEQVTLDDAHGDVTEIVFDHVQSSAAATAEELGRFGR